MNNFFIVTIRFLLRLSLISMSILYTYSLINMQNGNFYLFLMLITTYVLVKFEFLKIEEKVATDEISCEENIFYSQLADNFIKDKNKIVKSRSKTVKYEYVSRLTYSMLQVIILLPYLLFVIIVVYSDGDYNYISTTTDSVLYFVLIVSVIKKDIFFTKTLNVLLEYDVVERTHREKDPSKYMPTPSIFFIPYCMRYYISILSILLSCFSIAIVSIWL